MHASVCHPPTLLPAPLAFHPPPQAVLLELAPPLCHATDSFHHCRELAHPAVCIVTVTTRVTTTAVYTVVLQAPSPLARPFAPPMHWVRPGCRQLCRPHHACNAFTWVVFVSGSRPRHSHVISQVARHANMIYQCVAFPHRHCLTSAAPFPDHLPRPRPRQLSGMCSGRSHGVRRRLCRV